MSKLDEKTNSNLSNLKLDTSVIFRYNCGSFLMHIGRIDGISFETSKAFNVVASPHLGAKVSSTKRTLFD